MPTGASECVGLILLLIAVAVPALVLARGRITISEGQIAVVERRGRFTRTLEAGQHMLVPGLETVRALVPLNEFSFESGTQKVLTKNLLQLEINALVRYRIARHTVSEAGKKWSRIDTKAVYHAVYSAEDWQAATQTEAKATLAETFSQLDLRQDILDVPDWQEQVSDLLRQRLNERTRRWGVQVTGIAFSNVEFPSGVKELLYSETRLQREAHMRIVEAESLREIAATLNLSPADVINWRYVETLRELAKNPQARIVVSPDPFRETASDHPQTSSLVEGV